MILIKLLSFILLSFISCIQKHHSEENPTDFPRQPRRQFNAQGTGITAAQER
jgi:hypothetical protein